VIFYLEAQTMRKVKVVPHDPKWRDEFEVESRSVAEALGQNVVAVHHIGSTAIPGIHAKPIIDLLVEVRNLDKVDGQNLEMETLGYEVMGEFGISGRRFFRKDNSEGVRTHHIHAFETGSAQVERHLMFRNYMLAHPDDAWIYSNLKRELARKYPQDIDSYMDGKDGFIKEMDEKARQWSKSQMVQ
jgi:GrpB-like predicted nucleotidyltransferase (UPF0157 family)